MKAGTSPAINATAGGDKQPAAKSQLFQFANSESSQSETRTVKLLSLLGNK